MELRKEIADLLQVIDGTVEIINVTETHFLPANPSGKGVQFRYRHHAGTDYPDGIASSNFVPLECFAGHDSSGYVDAYLSMFGQK